MRLASPHPTIPGQGRGAGTPEAEGPGRGTRGAPPCRPERALALGCFAGVRSAVCTRDPSQPDIGTGAPAADALTRLALPSLPYPALALQRQLAELQAELKKKDHEAKALALDVQKLTVSDATSRAKADTLSREAEELRAGAAREAAREELGVMYKQLIEEYEKVRRAMSGRARSGERDGTTEP